MCHKCERNCRGETQTTSCLCGVVGAGGIKAANPQYAPETLLSLPHTSRQECPISERFPVTPRSSPSEARLSRADAQANELQSVWWCGEGEREGPDGGLSIREGPGASLLKNSLEKSSSIETESSVTRCARAAI